MIDSVFFSSFRKIRSFILGGVPTSAVIAMCSPKDLAIARIISFSLGWQ
jgi:hypothetical protein